MCIIPWFSYLFSYYGQQTGDFTIDVSQDAFLDKNMVLSETIDFQTKNSRLTAKPIGNVYPIGQYGAPEKIPIEIEASIEEFQSGSNNGLNYFAYTFYVKNDGKADFSYNLSIYIEDAQKNIDSAIRIMVICGKVYKKDLLLFYAKVQGNTGEYPGEPDQVVTFIVKEVVDTNRYEFNMVKSISISLMWLHGRPDCVDIEVDLEGVY